MTETARARAPGFRFGEEVDEHDDEHVDKRPPGEERHGFARIVARVVPSDPAGVGAAVVVLAVVAFLVWNLEPKLVFSMTTPTGGDYGGHLVVPWYMRHHLLPQGRITGWSPDWYDGWPIMTFYFPIPNLLIVALSFVMPYVVAFKITMILGIVTLPVSAWWFGRDCGGSRLAGTCMAVGTVPFLFNESYTIDGGNVYSTMAGEFAFSISLSLCLVFLAVVARGLRTGRHRGLAAVLFALTVASHLLGALLAVVGVAVLVALRARRPWTPLHRRIIWIAQGVRWAAATGVVGVALTGLWLVPFILRLPYATDMGYSKVTQYMQNLFPTKPPLEWTFIVMSAGAGLALLRRRRVFTLGAMCAGAGAGIALWPHQGYVVLAVATVLASGVMWSTRPLGVLLAVVGVLAGAGFRYLPSEAELYQPRMLPFWFLAVFGLAALAVADAGELAVAAWRWSSELRLREETVALGASLWRMATGYVFAAVVLVLVGVSLREGSPATGTPLLARSDAPGWVTWNMDGYERKAAYPEFRALMSMMARVGARHGCGRAFWEYAADLNNLGTTMAPMTLPYYTNECIDGQEGLYFESSATTPFHFIDQAELSAAPDYAMANLPYTGEVPDVALGVQHLQLLGVRYLMVFSPAVESGAAADPNLRLVDSSGPWPDSPGTSGSPTHTWRVYEVAGAELVEPLPDQPVVLKKLPPATSNVGPWNQAVFAWYGDPTMWNVELQQNGPPGWARVTAGTSRLPRRPEPHVRVSDVVAGVDSISFHVDRTGVPVLVKISYFPNWQASGAEGPWRASPNLMVVVPTSHDVRLAYGTTAVDWLGRGVTVAGLAGLAALVKAGRLDLGTPPEPVQQVPVRRTGPERDGTDTWEGTGSWGGPGSWEGADTWEGTDSWGGPGSLEGAGSRDDWGSGDVWGGGSSSGVGWPDPWPVSVTESGEGEATDGDAGDDERADPGGNGDNGEPAGAYREDPTVDGQEATAGARDQEEPEDGG